MLKWIKRLIKLAVLMMLLLALAVGVLLFYLNSVVKTAVERGGTFALGVPTTIQTLDLSLFRGTGEIKAFRIANPQGFAFPDFVRVRHAQISLDMPSLMTDTVHVEMLRIEGVSLTIEKTGKGSNFQVILDHLGRLSGRDSEAPSGVPRDSSTESKDRSGAGVDSGGGKNMLIDEIVIQEVSVNVNVDAVGLGITRVKKTITLDEPIRMQHIGSASDAKVQMAQVVGTLVKKLLAEIIRQAGGDLPGVIGRELGHGLNQLGKIGDLGVKVLEQGLAGKTGAIRDSVNKMKKTAEQVGGGLGKGVGKGIGQVGKTVGRVGQDVDAAAKGVLRGFGGLFNGKSDKNKKAPAPDAP